MHGLAIALLVVAVAVTAWCTLGFMLARDALARLHFMTPISTVALFAGTLAVVVDGPSTQSAIKAVIVLLVTAITSPVTQYKIAHATWVRRRARAEESAR
jgi:monovalent cation/proton antiporter MnhG/PhaG subunit